MKKISIKTKILLVLLFSIFIVIIFYLFFAINIFNKDKLAYVYSTSALLTETLASQTDSFINESVNSFFIMQKIKNNDVLLSVFNKTPNMIEFYVYNSKNKIIDRHLIKDNFIKFHNLRKDFFNVLRKKTDPEFYLNSSNNELTFKNIVIKNSPKIIAVIIKNKTDIYVSIIDYSPLAKTFSKSKLYNIKLLDKYGNILFNSEDKFNSDNSKIENPDIIQYARQNNLKTSVKEYVNESKENIITSYSKTNLNDLLLVSEVNKNKALSAAKVLINKSIIFAILLMSFGVIISIIFSRNITNPIKKIYEATKEIAKGNFGINIDINTNDEISILADSFNTMTNEIVHLMKETKDKARMEKELEIAKTVQDTLFPVQDHKTEIFQISSYYKSASECSGDWYDFFETSDKVVILIGDATGHGIPSALISATAHSCCETTWYIFKNKVDLITPSMLLEYLNNAVYKASRGQIQMTFFITIIDKKTGLCVYSNASHHPPLLCNPVLCKSKKDIVPLVDNNGSRLGAKNKCNYTDSQFYLKENDTLLFYTDGLVESRNLNNKIIGNRFIFNNLIHYSNEKIDIIKSKIINELNTFMINKDFDDDYSLILFRYLKNQRI